MEGSAHAEQAAADTRKTEQTATGTREAEQAAEARSTRKTQPGLTQNNQNSTSGSKQNDKQGENIMGALLAFAGSRRILTYVGCAFAAIAMLLSFGPYVCVWFVVRDLIAVAPQWQEATHIASYGWWAFGFALASIVLYFAGLLCTHLSAFRCASNMRKQTTKHLMYTSLGYFDSHASGALRRVVDGCASETEGLLAHKLPDTAGSIAMVVGMFALFFVFDWRLGIACLIPVLVSLGCIFYMMGGRGMDFMTRYMESLVAMNKAGTEYVRGIPVVKVFQQTVYSFRAFHGAINDFTHLAQTYAVEWCENPQSLSLTVVSGVAVLFVPIILWLSGSTSNIPQLITNVSFYAIFSAVIPTAVTRVMFMSDAVQTATDAMKRVNEVLSAPRMSVADSPQLPQDNSIVFDKVSFSYEGAEQAALSDVSFSVEAGTTVALVGPSGGGKTTAASLVPRFWDCTQGNVRVGGVDVRDIDPRVLMDQVAFVFQNNHLFAQSVLDNVRAARPEASREDVMEALEAAQCLDIIEKLPCGIDTVVGSEGTYFSGGEVQRLMLARAILKDAPIVVLDEATAFADPENEVKIQAAMKRLAQGRTTLMIAHRLSTVRNAHKIVVLNKGLVQEQGTHEELLARKGLYAQMWANYEQAVAWRIDSSVSAGSDSDRSGGADATSSHACIER